MGYRETPNDSARIVLPKPDMAWAVYEIRTMNASHRNLISIRLAGSFRIAGVFRYHRVIDWLLLALKRAEVMKAEAGRISVRFVGCLQTGSDHLLGNILIIRPLLFLLFACRADRLMIVNG
jgi:hypothetical protein